MTLREIGQEILGLNLTFATAVKTHELFIEITTELEVSILWEV